MRRRKEAQKSILKNKSGNYIEIEQAFKLKFRYGMFETSFRFIWLDHI